MSLMQKFLRDDSGAVLAEWVLTVVVIVTLGMVGLTVLRSDNSLADNSETSASGA